MFVYNHGMTLEKENQAEVEAKNEWLIKGLKYSPPYHRAWRVNNLQSQLKILKSPKTLLLKRDIIDM